MSIVKHKEGLINYSQREWVFADTTPIFRDQYSDQAK